MAKNDGILKIQGTLENLTFYKTQDGSLVRTKGGVSKKRIMKDPAFARTRENLSEFAGSAHAGKVMRMSVNELMQTARDNRVTSRLTQIMSQIQKMDTVNVRGKRQVSVGLESIEGKAALTRFDFKNRAPLGSILLAPYNVDAVTGEVSIADFVPGIYLSAPQGSTHVSLRSSFVKADFETGIYSGGSSLVQSLPLDMTSSNISLIPTAVPGGSGISFILLLVEFFQEVNTVQYPLRNGAHNSLSILEVL